MIRSAVILLTLTSSTVLGAPVPKHLMKDPPPEFYPGFLWNWSDRTYVVREVDGDYIRYVCQSHPWVRHCSDVQSKAVTRAEMSTCRQPDFQPHAPVTPEDDQ